MTGLPLLCRSAEVLRLDAKGLDGRTDFLIRHGLTFELIPQRFHVMHEVRSSDCSHLQVKDLVMLKARSGRVLGSLFGLTLVLGGSLPALPGCGGSSQETEVLTPPQPRQGRDTMEAYKASMKNKPAAKPTR